MKKKFLSLFLIGSLFFSQLSYAAIAHVQTKNSATQDATSATSITETFTSNVTTGNTVVLGVICFKSGSFAPDVSSVTDNYGNTYYQASSSYSGIYDRAGYIYYATNVTGGASFAVTVTMASSSSDLLMAMSEYSGIDTDPNTAYEDWQRTSGTSTTPTNTLTPTSADSLFFGLYLPYMGGGVTITPNDNGRSTRTAYHQYSHQDIIASGSGAQTVDWTIGASNLWEVWVITLRPQPAATSDTSGMFEVLD